MPCHLPCSLPPRQVLPGRKVSQVLLLLRSNLQGGGSSLASQADEDKAASTLAASEPAETADPQVAPKAANPASQAVIESTLVSSDGNTVYGTLSDPKATLSLAKGTRFKLRVHAVFPSATEKSIEVALPYGMQWDTDFAFDKTQGWVGELQADGVVAPSQQTDADKKPASVYGIGSAGALTLRFQDTTQEVTFDLPMGVAFGFDTGLTHIPNAIAVTQNYIEPGTAATTSKIATDIKVTNLDTLGFIGFGGDYANLLNKAGNLEVGPDSSTGHDVAWVASLSGVNHERRMLEDYFYAMLAPEKAEYLGRYSKEGNRGVKEADLKVLGPGERLTLSTGEEYVVPAGKKLYVWSRSDNSTIPVSGYECAFNPMWRFPQADFPVGSVAEISQIDVGVKYYNPYGPSSYMPYDAQRLRTMRYEIVEPKEDVYVNTTMYGRGEDWPLWEGYIADNEVYLGAPGFEHTQERTLGYFTVGNRGTADSRKKTILIDYDVNDTKIAGVTAQSLPFISRAKADGTQPTKISDFKVTLWNSKTGETSSYTLDAAALKQRFRVEDVLGKHIDGMYLKHIEYKIDTIPAKTAFKGYDSDWSGTSNAGFESKVEIASFEFYGQVLTNEVREKGKWGDDPSLFKTRIRIENTGDEEPNWHHRNQKTWDFNDGKGEVVLKYPGRSADHVTIGDTFTAFTGKSFIQGHGPATGWHSGTAHPLSLVLGEQKRGQVFDYFTPTWDGSSRGIQSYKAIYVVSPYGSDMSLSVAYRSLLSKEYWGVAGKWDDYTNLAKQPDIYEVPASDALKAEYPQARVYKLDFSKFTSADDFYDMRTFGPSVAWREGAKVVPYAINPCYWAYTGGSSIVMNYASDPEKDQPGFISAQLIWYEFDTATKEDLVYGSGFADDKWDLNGNGSTTDKIGRPMGSMEIKAPADLVVKSSAKMATQPDSQYITYDGLSKTLIGANSTVDYRLVASNPTKIDANGFITYWPVPKKGQDWGRAIQPNGAFQFDMFLNGGLKSALPAGYTISYARNATPTSQALDWGSFEWTDEDNTSAWTQQDWDAVNFVRISSPASGVFGAGSRQEFKFNLALRDVSKEDFEKKLIDVYTPTYLRDLGSGKGYRYGQPVAMTPTPGMLGGVAWVDANYDGRIDKSEAADVIAGMKIELYDARNKLVDTATTDASGSYVFRGLKDWSSNADGTLDAYTVKAYNPTDPTSTDMGTFVRFSPTKNDMAMTAADGQSFASVQEVTIESANAMALNIGLTRVTRVDVEKTWVEGKNADGTEGGTISHDALNVELLADGEAAKDIDEQAVPAANLSGMGETPWKGTYGNLLANSPSAGVPITYTVKETNVPEGYVASYAYRQQDDKDAQGEVVGSHTVATVTNTRIHGTIKVSKVDKADATKPLPNTGFELRLDGKKVREGVTDDSGVLSFADVPYGTYEVVETAAPTGYVLDATPHEVTIATQGQVASLTVGDEQIKGSVLVSKVDAQNEGKALPGAEFELRQDDKVVARGTTGSDGTLSFAGVAYGTYELVETRAPEGYEINRTSSSVKIEEHGAVVRLVVKDVAKVSALPRTGDRNGGVGALLLGAVALTVTGGALRKKRGQR